MFSLEGLGITHPGKVRARNEDALLIRNPQSLWAIADGMGGHSAGEYASQLLTQYLARVPSLDDPVDQIEAIDDALVRANDDLRREAVNRGVDIIGSTVCVIVQKGAFAFCGWVGDSRIYEFRNDVLHQCSMDHSDAQEMLSQGLIEPKEFEKLRAQSPITRAIGGASELHIDWQVIPLVAGMRLFMCTDGVNKEIDDPQLAEILRTQTSAADIMKIIEKNVMAGAARDNFTAIVVDVSERAE